MPSTHRLAARDVPVAADVDVLVVGAGPAGVGAAVAAARGGATVMLAEHYGFLGGAHASGEIGTFAGLYLNTTDEDLPRFIGRGINAEVVAGLRGATSADRPQTALTGPQRWFRTYIEIYDPFWLRVVLDRLVRSAGVRTLLHATGLEPILEGGRVAGVVLGTKSGYQAVRAKVVVDASGDADIVARAGASFALGQDGTLQHPTLMFRMFGVDTERLRYVGWPEIGQLMRDHGEQYGLNRFFPGCFLGCRDGEVLLNVTKVVRPDGSSIDATDMWDLTYAEFEGREAVVRYERFFRERVPGFEKARVNVTGASIAVRETRLVDGLYRLRREDVLEARRFDDGIAFSAWPIERMEGDQVSLEWVPDGSGYEVPFRCLVPAHLDGALVAGRCLSAEHVAHASARTWSVCLDMGEAAGRAAAQSVDRGVPVRDVDVDRIRVAMGLVESAAAIPA